MMSRGRQVLAVAGLAGRMLVRSWGLVVASLVAIGLTGTGGFWREFNFGASESRFLLNYGWGLQNLMGMAVVMAVGVQLWSRMDADGLWPVWRSRGGRAGDVVAGLALALVGWAVVLVAASTGLVAVVSGADLSFGEWGAAGLRLAAKLALVGLVGLWWGSYGRGVGFVLVVTLGLVVLGHLRPWAAEVGGWVEVVSWLAPDFAALGVVPGGAVDRMRLVVMTMGYGVVLIVLGARGVSARGD